MIDDVYQKERVTQGANIQFEWSFTNANAAVIVRKYPGDAGINWILVVP